MDGQARPAMYIITLWLLATPQQPPSPRHQLSTAPSWVQVRNGTPGLVLARVRCSNIPNDCSPAITITGFIQVPGGP